jgi:hypothetical protein
VARLLIVEVRQIVVTTLKAAPAVAAIVDGRVYGADETRERLWPFARVDLPTAIPAFDGCGDASEITFRTHGFAEGADERAVGALMNAQMIALDGLRVQIADDPVALLKDLVWTGTQVLKDTGAANGWHGFSNWRAEVSG